jgi:hypothetical protein
MVSRGATGDTVTIANSSTDMAVIHFGSDVQIDVIEEIGRRFHFNHQS